MKIDLQTIEKMAPDQSSLQAAAGLTKVAKWSAAGMSADGQLIWGACAGSGANPYRVMADLSDLGNKCTCPSRKFPCKHVLAMLWGRAENILPFAIGDAPDWVVEWLGRRRKAGAATPVSGTAETASKDVHAALRQQVPAPPLDPDTVARRQAATQKRASEMRAAILDGLDALEQWVGDQLRLGLSGFLDDVTGRCRRIAARLVDAKAGILAGRIDELPSCLLALPPGDRVRGAVVELGKLVLLARAYRAAPDDSDIARAVALAETREAILDNPATPKVTAMWEVLGERIETRRDGLVSQTTWLLNLSAAGPRFAMLLDHFPASAGKRGSVFDPGEQFEAELAFYPARLPLRALLINRAARVETEAISAWPKQAIDAGTLRTSIAYRLAQEPWSTHLPVLLPSGRIAIDIPGQAWWRSKTDELIFRVNHLAEGLIRATDLERSAAIWSVSGVTLLAAQTRWGRIGCVG